VSTSLKDFHDAIIQAVTDHFDGKVHVLVYPEELSQVQTPAVLLEMDSGEDGQDLGDDRISLSCQFALHCILGFKTENIGLAVRDFSSQVFILLKDNLFGCGRDVSRPENISMSPGEFKPGVAGYESWCVTWEQTIFLGVSAWNDTGVVPEIVMLGIAPDIGIGHEPDYEDITDV
jgi:hypothetical protein